MKSIIEYQDYRQFMQDFYENRKRTSAFSWREFSRLAGFSSPVYLKLVCEGKSSLSLVRMHQVAAAMNLTGYELDYFKLMVEFGNSQKDDVKKRLLEQMQQIAKAHNARLVDEEAFEYYQDWTYPVIRELAPMMPGAKPGELAKACCQDTSAVDVRTALGFLVRRGFLVESSPDVYQQTEKLVVGSKEGLALAIREMHREMGALGVKSLDQFSSRERDVTGVTLGVNRAAYLRIVEELTACRKRIIDIAGEYDNLDQVYRLNLQFFPLTKNVEDVKDEK